MTEIKVDFNFAPEIVEGAMDAEVEVEHILDEIKQELVGSASAMGDDVAELNANSLCHSEN